MRIRGWLFWFAVDSVVLYHDARGRAGGLRFSESFHAALVASEKNSLTRCSIFSWSLSAGDVSASEAATLGLIEELGMPIVFSLLVNDLDALDVRYEGLAASL